MSAPSDSIQEGQEPAPPNYKEMLDAAAKNKGAGQHQPEETPGVVEKVLETVSQHVPALAKMLGHEEPASSETSNASQPPPGPPVRPEHDAAIEDFVRDQHRSKAVASQIE